MPTLRKNDPIEIQDHSPAVTTGARPVRQKTNKQAVVIVHGIGEQKPLETLRGFVEAVWSSKPTPSVESSPHDTWLVPDRRAGLKELARITTRQNDDGVRTDFYELYWSDLMTGNTLGQFRGWLTGLLLRWPHEVPKETFLLWIVLWALTLIVVAIAVVVGLDDPLGSLSELASSELRVQSGWTQAASFLLGLAIAVFLARRLDVVARHWENEDRIFPGIWAGETPRRASVSILVSAMAVVVVPVALGLAAYYYLPWAVFGSWKSWLLILAAAIVIIGQRLVIPYFGDVARYVSTSPDAVAARSDIRERGLQLLRDLHGISPDRDTRAARNYDPGDNRDYDRIVLVGHSLGSIVAYDILRLLWEEVGPSRNSPPTRQAMTALTQLDEYLRDCSADACRPDPTSPPPDDDPAPRLNIADLRGMQSNICAALAEREGGWRVTDFVSLGSPLSHAEFLISRDRTAFEERKAERMYPTCPPVMEPRKALDADEMGLAASKVARVDPYSFLYEDQEGAVLPHHAAPFAATRWVNIYDTGFLFGGDPISGSCQANFGPGILDLPVEMRRPGVFSRIVTHTHYWNTEASGRAEDVVLAELGVRPDTEERQDHVLLLRAALDLGVVPPRPIQPKSLTKKIAADLAPRSSKAGGKS